MSRISFAEIPALIKDAKNPMIVTGAKSNDCIIEQAMKLSDKLGIHIAATGNTIADFRGKDFKRCSKEWIAEVTNFMIQPEWQGYDGKGKPDMIIFAGYLSSVLDRFLATLRAFTSCKTLTLDNKYMANATFSLSPLSLNDWETKLKDAIEQI